MADELSARVDGGGCRKYARFEKVGMGVSMLVLGQIAGGIVGVFILYALLEWAIIKRVFDDPVRGKAVAVISAYFLAVILSGFGRANGGPWNPEGILIYLPGLFVVGFFAIRRGMNIRDESAPEVADTFR